MSERSLWKVNVAYSWTMQVFNGNSAVTGLVNANFTKKLALNDVNSAVAITATEIDSVNEPGWYKITFTPNATGHWVSTASHATYSPQGWKDEIQVYNRDFDDHAFPTSSGNSIGVNGSGQVGIDWNNIGAPTTTQNLSGTTISTVTNSVGSVTGAVGSVTGAVGSVTGNVGGNVVGSVASVTGAVGSVTGNVGGSTASVTGAVGSVTGAVGSVTGNVGGNVVGSVASVTGSVGSVTGAVGSVTGNVGGDLSGNVIKKVLGGGATAFTAVGVQSDVQTWLTSVPNVLVSGRVDTSIGAVASAAYNAIADGLLDRAAAVDTYTPRQVLRLIGAVLCGKASGGPSNSVFRSMDDTANRVASVATNVGDRTSVTLTP